MRRDRVLGPGGYVIVALAAIGCGASSTNRRIVPINESERNGEMPVAISYITQPRLNRSERPPSGSPCAYSGDMY